MRKDRMLRMLWENYSPKKLTFSIQAINVSEELEYSIDIYFCLLVTL